MPASVIAVPSRIAKVIELVEKGEPVNFRQVVELQALDLARAGELFAEQTIAMEIAADDRFAEIVTRASK
jgi:hypothetical protein